MPPALKPLEIPVRHATGPAVAVTAADGLILVDASAGPVTCTLPAAAGVTGLYVRVKKIDPSGNPVTIGTSGGELIGGLAAWPSITLRWNNLGFVSDGTDWYVL